MGFHEPRTAADEIADALADLADVRVALRNLTAQLADLKLDDEATSVAHQVRRNAMIALAKTNDAERHVRESNRVQLTVVS